MCVAINSKFATPLYTMPKYENTGALEKWIIKAMVGSCDLFQSFLLTVLVENRCVGSVPDELNIIIYNYINEYCVVALAAHCIAILIGYN